MLDYRLKTIYISTTFKNCRDGDSTNRKFSKLCFTSEIFNLEQETSGGTNLRKVILEIQFPRKKAN